MHHSRMVQMKEVYYRWNGYFIGATYMAEGSDVLVQDVIGHQCDQIGRFIELWKTF